MKKGFLADGGESTGVFSQTGIYVYVCVCEWGGLGRREKGGQLIYGSLKLVQVQNVLKGIKN